MASFFSSWGWCVCFVAIAIDVETRLYELQQPDVKAIRAPTELLINSSSHVILFRDEAACAPSEIFNECFSIFGAPGLFASSGILYYEVEILKINHGEAQFGFALQSLEAEGRTFRGIGDDENSWGYDGTRGLRKHGATVESYETLWMIGDIVGFSANVDAGLIAVSLNGVWDNSSFFQNEAIKKGVLPALSGYDYSIRYNFDGDSHGKFTHARPPNTFWDVLGHSQDWLDVRQRKHIPVSRRKENLAMNLEKYELDEDELVEHEVGKDELSVESGMPRSLYHENSYRRRGDKDWYDVARGYFGTDSHRRRGDALTRKGGHIYNRRRKQADRLRRRIPRKTTTISTTTSSTSTTPPTTTTTTSTTSTTWWIIPIIYLVAEKVDQYVVQGKVWIEPGAWCVDPEEGPLQLQKTYPDTSQTGVKTVEYTCQDSDPPPAGPNVQTRTRTVTVRGPLTMLPMTPPTISIPLNELGWAEKAKCYCRQIKPDGTPGARQTTGRKKLEGDAWLAFDAGAIHETRCFMLCKEAFRIGRVTDLHGCELGGNGACYAHTKPILADDTACTKTGIVCWSARVEPQACCEDFEGNAIEVQSTSLPGTITAGIFGSIFYCMEELTKEQASVPLSMVIDAPPEIDADPLYVKMTRGVGFTDPGGVICKDVEDGVIANVPLNSISKLAVNSVTWSGLKGDVNYFAGFDGSTSTTCGGCYNVGEPDPAGEYWIMFDLGSPRVIHRFKLYKETSGMLWARVGFGEKWKDFSKNTGIMWGCNHAIDAIGWGEYSCIRPFAGRMLSIATKDRVDPFTLCEIEIYGTAGPAPPSGFYLQGTAEWIPGAYGYWQNNYCGDETSHYKISGDHNGWPKYKGVECTDCEMRFGDNNRWELWKGNFKRSVFGAGFALQNAILRSGLQIFWSPRPTGSGTCKPHLTFDVADACTWLFVHAAANKFICGDNTEVGIIGECADKGGLAACDAGKQMCQIAATDDTDPDSCQRDCNKGNGGGQRGCGTGSVGLAENNAYFLGDWQGTASYLTADVGVSFTAVVKLEVTHLGRHERASNVLKQSVLVTLWSTSTESAIATAIVTPTSPKSGNYRYETLATPVVLESGKEYRLTQQCTISMLDEWFDGEVPAFDLFSTTMYQYAELGYGVNSPTGVYGYPIVQVGLYRRAGMVTFKFRPFASRMTQVGHVDVDKGGTYAYVYTCVDSIGQSTTLTRAIEVGCEGPNPPGMYGGNDVGCDSDASSPVKKLNFAECQAHCLDQEDCEAAVFYDHSNANKRRCHSRKYCDGKYFVGTDALSITRKVGYCKRVDNPPRVILDPSACCVNQFGIWNEGGVRCQDNEDIPPPTVVKVDTVSTNVPGFFTVRYRCTDTLGQVGVASRNVTVKAPCQALTQITNVDSPSCAEGYSIPHGGVCTTRCIHPFMPSPAEITCTTASAQDYNSSWSTPFSCGDEPCQAPSVANVKSDSQGIPRSCEQGEWVITNVRCKPNCLDGYIAQPLDIADPTTNMKCYKGDFTPTSFYCKKPAGPPVYIKYLAPDVFFVDLDWLPGDANDCAFLYFEVKKAQIVKGYEETAMAPDAHKWADVIGCAQADLSQRSAAACRAKNLIEGATYQFRVREICSVTAMNSDYTMVSPPVVMRFVVRPELLFQIPSMEVTFNPQQLMLAWSVDVRLTDTNKFGNTTDIHINITQNGTYCKGGPYSSSAAEVVLDPAGANSFVQLTGKRIVVIKPPKDYFKEGCDVNVSIMEGAQQTIDTPSKPTPYTQWFFPFTDLPPQFAAFQIVTKGTLYVNFKVKWNLKTEQSCTITPTDPACARACWAEYSLGAQGSPECPSGYYVIVDGAECEVAARSLGLPWSPATSPSWCPTARPKGCFHHIPQDLVYYNDQCDGGVQYGDDRRLCKKAPVYIDMSVLNQLGACADGSGNAYDNWRGSMLESQCEQHCNSLSTCLGYDYNDDDSKCELLFEDGNLPVTKPGDAFTDSSSDIDGTGPIEGVVDDGSQRKCKKKVFPACEGACFATEVGVEVQRSDTSYIEYAVSGLFPGTEYYANCTGHKAGKPWVPNDPIPVSRYPESTFKTVQDTEDGISMFSIAVSPKCYTTTTTTPKARFSDISYFLSCSGASGPTQSCEMAMDGDVATKWCENGQTNPFSHWLVFDFGQPVFLTGIGGLSSAGNSGGVSRTPSAMNLQGGMTGNPPWALEHYATPKDGQDVLTFPPTNSYRFWRIEVLSTHGGWQACFSELVFLQQAVQWIQSAGGESCDDACSSIGSPCREDVWPTSEDHFEAILSIMGGSCGPISRGGWSYSPRKFGSKCAWEGSGSLRCGLNSPGWSIRRFCPCVAEAPVPETAKYFKHSLKHCLDDRLLGEDFSSVAAAQDRCLKLSSCWGVYDQSCDESYLDVFLCDSSQITSVASLTTSGSSCVYEKQVFVCTTAAGTGCMTCDPQASADNQCGSCNPGYKLAGTNCEEWFTRTTNVTDEMFTFGYTLQALDYKMSCLFPPGRNLNVGELARLGIQASVAPVSEYATIEWVSGPTLDLVYENKGSIMQPVIATVTFKVCSLAHASDSSIPCKEYPLQVQLVDINFDFLNFARYVIPGATDLFTEGMNYSEIFQDGRNITVVNANVGSGASVYVETANTFDFSTTSLHLGSTVGSRGFKQNSLRNMEVGTSVLHTLALTGQGTNLPLMISWKGVSFPSKIYVNFTAPILSVPSQELRIDSATALTVTLANVPNASKLIDMGIAGGADSGDGYASPAQYIQIGVYKKNESVNLCGQTYFQDANDWTKATCYVSAGALVNLVAALLIYDYSADDYVLCQETRTEGQLEYKSPVHTGLADAGDWALINADNSIDFGLVVQRDTPVVYVTGYQLPDVAVIQMGGARIPGYEMKLVGDAEIDMCASIAFKNTTTLECPLKRCLDVSGLLAQPSLRMYLGDLVSASAIPLLVTLPRPDVHDFGPQNVYDVGLDRTMWFAGNHFGEISCQSTHPDGTQLVSGRNIITVGQTPCLVYFQNNTYIECKINDPIRGARSTNLPDEFTGLPPPLIKDKQPITIRKGYLESRNEYMTARGEIRRLNSSDDVISRELQNMYILELALTVTLFPCNPGYKRIRDDIGECVPCPKGRFSTPLILEFPLTCERCPASQYSDIEGATACKACPVNTYASQPSDSIRSCICKAGYYSQYLNQSSGFTIPGTECTPCHSKSMTSAPLKTEKCGDEMPISRYCDAPKESVCTSESEMSNYWMVCKAYCPGGVIWPLAKAAFYSLDASSLGGNKFLPKMIRCDPPEACLPWNECAYRYTGYSCGECTFGFYRDDRSGLCVPCGQEQVIGIVVMAAVCIVMTIGGLFGSATFMRVQADIVFRNEIINMLSEQASVLAKSKAILTLFRVRDKKKIVTLERHDIGSSFRFAKTGDLGVVYRVDNRGQIFVAGLHEDSCVKNVIKPHWKIISVNGTRISAKTSEDVASYLARQGFPLRFVFAIAKSGSADDNGKNFDDDRKMFVMLIGVMNSFNQVSMFDFEWPPMFTKLAELAAQLTLNFNFFKPECSVPTPYNTKWMGFIAIPYIMMIPLTISYIGMMCYMFPGLKGTVLETKRWLLRNAYARTVNMSVILLLPFHLDMLLVPFACIERAEGAYFVSATPDTQCSSVDPRYAEMLRIAFVGFMVMTFFYSLLVFSLWKSFYWQFGRARVRDTIPFYVGMVEVSVFGQRGYLKELRDRVMHNICAVISYDSSMSKFELKEHLAAAATQLGPRSRRIQEAAMRKGVDVQLIAGRQDMDESKAEGAAGDKEAINDRLEIIKGRRRWIDSKFSQPPRDGNVVSYGWVLLVNLMWRQLLSLSAIKLSAGNLVVVGAAAIMLLHAGNITMLLMFKPYKSRKVTNVETMMLSALFLVLWCAIIKDLLSNHVNVHLFQDTLNKVNTVIDIMAVFLMVLVVGLPAYQMQEIAMRMFLSMRSTDSLLDDIHMTGVMKEEKLKRENAKQAEQDRIDELNFEMGLIVPKDVGRKYPMLKTATAKINCTDVVVPTQEQRRNFYRMIAIVKEFGVDIDKMREVEKRKEIQEAADEENRLMLEEFARQRQEEEAGSGFEVYTHHYPNFAQSSLKKVREEWKPNVSQANEWHDGEEFKQVASVASDGASTFVTGWGPAISSDSSSSADLGLLSPSSANSTHVGRIASSSKDSFAAQESMKHLLSMDSILEQGESQESIAVDWRMGPLASLAAGKSYKAKEEAGFAKTLTEDEMRPKKKPVFFGVQRIASMDTRSPASRSPLSGTLSPHRAQSDAGAWSPAPSIKSPGSGRKLLSVSPRANPFYLEPPSEGIGKQSPKASEASSSSASPKKAGAKKLSVAKKPSGSPRTARAKSLDENMTSPKKARQKSMERSVSEKPKSMGSSVSEKQMGRSVSEKPVRKRIWRKSDAESMKATSSIKSVSSVQSVSSPISEGNNEAVPLLGNSGSPHDKQDKGSASSARMSNTSNRKGTKSESKPKK